MPDNVIIPSAVDLMKPTLEALKALGGSARIDEIVDWVTESQGFSEEQQSLKRKPDHSMTMVEYQLAWARNNLKNIGAIENSVRGVWSITEHGRSLSADDVLEEAREWRTAYNRAYQERKRQAAEAGGDGELELDDDVSGTDDWKGKLLSSLMSMAPDAFERLAQRLLKEANFRNVEVLGKSGDGGIDGVGVYRLSLVSFPVYFQCKRYSSAVGSSAVRDFRGAMAGRGDKGLLITTASFTKDARAEASRDGAPPVELIDGDDLCDLLKEYELGVKTTLRTVEDVTVTPEFFADI